MESRKYGFDEVAKPAFFQELFLDGYGKYRLLP